MKVECIKEKIALAARIGSRMTGKNVTLPILSCVLLVAEKGTLTLKATNLEIGAEITVPAKIIEEGSVAIPGNVFSSFLEAVTDRTVVLEKVGGNLSVSGASNKTVLKAFDTEDFPTIPQGEYETNFKMNSADFVRGLTAVCYSAASSSMKPELSSIFISHAADELVFAATDSFRLAEKKIHIKKLPEFSNILIPEKNVAEIIKALEEEGDEVEININKNQVSFTHGNIFLTSRLVDGTFPDYKQIIPKDFKTEAVILKEDLSTALKLAHIFSDSFNQITVTVHPSKKTFELRTKNNDVGENSNKLQAALKGEDLEINFNFRYLADSFQSIESDSLTLGFNGLSKAMVMRGVGEKTFTYLVMPMNR